MPSANPSKKNLNIAPPKAPSPSAVSFRYLGPNPTVDLVVTLGEKVLLVRRSQKSPAEPGKWALPGGFVDTCASRGMHWRPGKESAPAAAVRELREETGLHIRNLPDLESRMRFVGVFEGCGRDPRDSEKAWARSHAFKVDLLPSDNLDPHRVSAGDDASSAEWFPLNSLPNLAFDHLRIIAKATGKRRNNPPHCSSMPAKITPAPPK